MFFTGEYESKVDAKGRLVLPSKIKSQLPDNASNELVIRKGFESCLILYPMVEFKKTFFSISGLSEFNEESRKLQRNFFSGTSMVELDANGRLLIPKNMLYYSQIEKEAVLVGMGSKVELWSSMLYTKQKITNPQELSKLAQKYLDS